LTHDASRITHEDSYVVSGVKLIPSSEEIAEDLTRTAAFREVISYIGNKHTAHYFRCRSRFAITTRRSLAVALSRSFASNGISPIGTKDLIISPASSIIPVAESATPQRRTDLLGRAENANALRQYVIRARSICIMSMTFHPAATNRRNSQLRALGAPIIGCGAIVHFTSAPDSIAGGVPHKIAGGI
jgi:hypothetical protein